VFLGVATGTLRLLVSPRVLAGAFLVVFVAFLAFFGAGQAQREGGSGRAGRVQHGFVG
jgi:hypothetical protein